LMVAEFPLLLLSEKRSENGRNTFLVFFCYVVPEIVFLIFLGLVSLKLSCDCIPWWGVLLPLWLCVWGYGLGLWIIMVIHHNRVFDKIFTLLIYLSLLFLLVLLGFKLDDILPYSYILILLPAILLSIFLIAYPLLSLLFFVVRPTNSHSHTELEHWFKSASGLSYVVVGVFWILGVPMGSFVVLVVLKVEYGAVGSWLMVYVPLYVVLGVMFFVWLVVFCLGIMKK